MISIESVNLIISHLYKIKVDLLRSALAVQAKILSTRNHQQLLNIATDHHWCICNAESCPRRLRMISKKGSILKVDLITGTRVLPGQEVCAVQRIFALVWNTIASLRNTAFIYVYQPFRTKCLKKIKNNSSLIISRIIFYNKFTFTCIKLL